MQLHYLLRERNNMRIQNLSAVNRFYSQQAQLQKTAVTRPLQYAQNQVSFGECSISRLNVGDAVKAYTKLLVVPVEKIADDPCGIKFETVENFPLLDGYKMCEAAKKKMKQMHEALAKFKIEGEESLGQFTKTLYEYTQMGGGGTNIARFIPGGDCHLCDATTKKVITPIIIEQVLGVHSGDVKAIETYGDTLTNLLRIFKTKSNITTIVDGEKYILNRSDECRYTGTLFSAQKISK